MTNFIQNKISIYSSAT